MVGLATLCIPHLGEGSCFDLTLLGIGNKSVNLQVVEVHDVCHLRFRRCRLQVNSRYCRNLRVRSGCVSGASHVGDQFFCSAKPKKHIEYRSKSQ
jgi:hypothetical protein